MVTRYPTGGVVLDLSNPGAVRLSKDEINLGGLDSKMSEGKLTPRQALENLLSETEAAMDRRDFRAARISARKLIVGDEAEPDYKKEEGYLLLAEAFYHDGKYANVVGTCDVGFEETGSEALSRFVNDKIVNNYGAGVRDVRAGNYANGRKQLRRVVALQSGELNEATAEHTRALKAQFWIAESYTAEGKHGNARVALRKLLDLPELKEKEYNHAQVHYKLGLSLHKDRKEGAAKTAFRAAVKLDPGHEAKTYLK